MSPEITPFSVSVLALAAVGIGLVLSRIARDRLRIRSGIIWVFAWASVGIIAVFPDFLNLPLGVSQMRNRFLFALALAILALLALQFSLYSRLDQVDRAMRRAHRELAIANYRLDELTSASGSMEIRSDEQVR